MKIMKRLSLALGLATFALGLAMWSARAPNVLGQHRPGPEATAGVFKIGKEPERPDAAVFHQSDTPKAASQKVPDYKATAGMLKIGKEPERPDAEIFHVAYTLNGADPAKRPVTFVFNGGPGAASIYLHISAIGPKSLVTAGDGSFPAVPARLEDNTDSWIGFTDLVFIDPVGTGYSRMLPRARWQAW